MSTRHYVHNIITPGLPGDGIDNAEAEVIRRKLEPINIVSADWYSDPNDAIAEAGVGGHVKFTEGVTYNISEPIRPLSGQTIEGGDRGSTNIITSGDAAIASPTPTTAQLQNVIVRGLNLVGNDAAGVGLDARGMTRCRFDDLWIEGFTVHGVWWGGDQPTDVGGWSNLAYNLRVRAPLNGGAAMYFGGRVGAGGPATANNIVVFGGSLYTRDHPDSYAILIDHGGANRFYGIDMGYGVNSGAAIRLSHDLARQNLFSGIRTENVKRAVVITGGKYNVFEACAFGLYTNSDSHGAEIGSGSSRNVFRDNWWSATGLAPRVWESGGPGSYQTIIDDMMPDYGTTYSNTVTDPRGRVTITATGTSVAWGVKAQSDAGVRLRTTASGTFDWGPGDGTLDTRLERRGPNTLATGSNDKFIADGGLGVSSLVPVSGTLGTMIRRMPIYDETGTHIGYIPVYDTIT